ncbi:hypothetical protein FRC06_000932 [Ceratobasidium sp. 370]|nr:hypothetical protein FRC06_000932 [Ceratobasidium sp. 370]
MGSDTRSKFFADLDKAYTEKRVAGSVHDQIKRYEPAAGRVQTRSCYGLYQTRNKTPRKIPQPATVYGEAAMDLVYYELIAALRDIFETLSNPPGLVVAIDEAHPLCKRPEPFSPPHTLTRVINTLSPYKPHIPP